MARAKIRNGELPCSEHPKTWGGRGRGSPCSLCGTAVEPEQLEFEVEVVESGCVAPTILRFHVPCHTAWLEECEAAPLAHAG